LTCDPKFSLKKRSPGVVRTKFLRERAIAVVFVIAIRSLVNGLTLKDALTSLNDLLIRWTGTIT